MRWESKPQPRFGGMEDDDVFGGDRFESRFGGGVPARSSGGSYSSGGVHSYRDTTSAASKQRPLASARTASASAPASSAPMLQLQQGEMVDHTAFGRGMVLSVRPMGGDALVEVAFDKVGTKKLMLKSAGKHMKKV